MHAATGPARNQAGLDAGEYPATSLMSIVADMMSLIVQVQASTSAHFPKSALRRRNISWRTSESHGHQQIHDSSAAFDLKSLNPILPQVSQGLQIGGTSLIEAEIQRDFGGGGNETADVVIMDDVTPAMPLPARH